MHHRLGMAEGFEGIAAMIPADAAVDRRVVTEEIHLNKGLAENGIESLEADLGEYIRQLDGEASYPIVTPAMHKSKEDVARVFPSGTFS